MDLGEIKLLTVIRKIALIPKSQKLSSERAVKQVNSNESATTCSVPAYLGKVPILKCPSLERFPFESVPMAATSNCIWRSGWKRLYTPYVLQIFRKLQNSSCRSVFFVPHLLALRTCSVPRKWLGFSFVLAGKERNCKHVLKPVKPLTSQVSFSMTFASA